MSSAKKVVQTSDTLSSNVIYPEQFGLSSRSGQTFSLFDYINDESTKETLKDMVESFLSEYIVSQYDLAKADDPFDSIYISILKPDELKPDWLNHLDSLKNIDDLSVRAKFDDGWDD